MSTLSPGLTVPIRPCAASKGRTIARCAPTRFVATLPPEAESKDLLEHARVVTLAASEAMPDFIVKQQITRSRAFGNTNNWVTGQDPAIFPYNATPLKVGWTNITVSIGGVNQLVGRFAYWVDDESAKINLNTALEHLSTEIKGLEQNMRKINQENRNMAEKIDLASTLIVSELKFKAVNKARLIN